MPYFNHEQGRCYYEISGNGTPLLLIAGLASDVQSWATIKKQLAKRYQVILFDNRGVGRTDLDVSNLTVSQMASDAVALLRFLDVDKTHVLGHSMGGMIAMHLAANNPELVDRLVLAATTTELNQRQKLQLNDWATYLETGMDKELWFKNLFYWLYSDNFFEHKAMLTAYIIGALSYPYPILYTNFKEQVNAINAFKGSLLVTQITQPTLLISPEYDRLFSDERSRANLAKIPGCTEATLENAGHSLHVEQPEAFFQLVSNYL